MTSLVTIKGWLGSECLSTPITYIGPLTCVKPLMLSAGRAIPKGLSTFAALVRLLSGMNSLMSYKVGSMSEGFPTVCTFIRLLSCMDFLMSGKIGTFFEKLPALLTFKGFFSFEKENFLKKLSRIPYIRRVFLRYEFLNEQQDVYSAEKLSHTPYIYKVSLQKLALWWPVSDMLWLKAFPQTPHL